LPFSHAGSETEYAVDAAVLLMVRALIKGFPHKGFAATRTLIAIVYLSLLAHGVLRSHYVL
jgi:type III secretory pathway component EscV